MRGSEDRPSVWRDCSLCVSLAWQMTLPGKHVLALSSIALTVAAIALTGVVLLRSVEKRAEQDWDQLRFALGEAKEAVGEEVASELGHDTLFFHGGPGSSSCGLLRSRRSESWGVQIMEQYEDRTIVGTGSKAVGFAHNLDVWAITRRRWFSTTSSLHVDYSEPELRAAVAAVLTEVVPEGVEVVAGPKPEGY